MASFEVLDQREEDELHKSRLLNVEEKPFKRVSKRLLTPSSLLNTPSKLLTPPPDGESSQEEDIQNILAARQQFKDDILLDFAIFESSIARVQFLRNSNERERERYQADKERILETKQQVRESTAQLRIQLEEAKQTLEQRKKFDELAEKITGNRLLRPREDQQANLRKLEEECRELERESRQYGETWKERREQFGRIVEEGMLLRRLIRDEKEEVERREGMDGGEEDGEVGEGSRAGSPRGDKTPGHSDMTGNETPGAGRNSPERGLKPRPMPMGSLSRPGSRATSRALSPAVSERRRAPDDEDATMNESSLRTVESNVAPDTPMADSQVEADTPLVTIEEPAEDGLVEAEDKMDTS